MDLAEKKEILTSSRSSLALSQLISAPVIVAALGYFVDIYDLLLFGVVRLPSLASLGLSESEISVVGASILNWQMAGLLLGGIFWGVLGDKKGRLTVLFGSIITYSIANIACGFVQDPVTYRILRFVAGLGLAGELGAGITLVSEILPIRLRAFGSSLVAGVGILGAIAAYFTASLLDWRIAYFVGGAMGISLLLLRVGVLESGMFKNLKQQKHVKKGNFFALFSNRKRFIKYFKCVAIGVPTWFVMGIIATFSNEFGKALEISEPIVPGLSITFGYAGMFLGDITSGFVSQWLRSRKKAVFYSMLFTLAFILVYFYAGIKSANQLYLVTTLLGFGIGYWALFVTISSEQFGTNLRATATTSIPGMVRGAVIIMTTLFTAFKSSTGVINAAMYVAIPCFIIAIYSILTIEETSNRDLNFIEE